MDILAIWFFGLVLTLKNALRVWRIKAPVKRKVVAVGIMMLMSWVGLLFYDFYGRQRMAGWLKEPVPSVPKRY